MVGINLTAMLNNSVLLPPLPSCLLASASSNHSHYLYVGTYSNTVLHSKSNQFKNCYCFTGRDECTALEFMWLSNDSKKTKTKNDIAPRDRSHRTTGTANNQKHTLSTRRRSSNQTTAVQNDLRLHLLSSIVRRAII